VGQDIDALTGLLHEQAATWLTQYNELLAENARLRAIRALAQDIARSWYGHDPFTVEGDRAIEHAVKLLVDALESYSFGE
jgi:hypothetical protein